MGWLALEGMGNLSRATRVRSRFRRALRLVAVGASYADAARAAGLCERTFRRRLAKLRPAAAG